MAVSITTPFNDPSLYGEKWVLISTFISACTSAGLYVHACVLKGWGARVHTSGLRRRVRICDQRVMQCLRNAWFGTSIITISSFKEKVNKRNSHLQDFGRACFLRDISAVAVVVLAVTAAAARWLHRPARPSPWRRTKQHFAESWSSACGPGLRHEMNIELPES